MERCHQTITEIIDRWKDTGYHLKTLIIDRSPNTKMFCASHPPASWNREAIFITHVLRTNTKTSETAILVYINIHAPVPLHWSPSCVHVIGCARTAGQEATSTNITTDILSLTISLRGKVHKTSCKVWVRKAYMQMHNLNLEGCALHHLVPTSPWIHCDVYPSDDLYHMLLWQSHHAVHRLVLTYSHMESQNYPHGLHISWWGRCVSSCMFYIDSFHACMNLVCRYQLCMYSLDWRVQLSLALCWDTLMVIPEISLSQSCESKLHDEDSLGPSCGETCNE